MTSELFDKIIGSLALLRALPIMAIVAIAISRTRTVYNRSV
jgi:hypothetical protein